MFELLQHVHQILDRAGVPHALIGAGAMSVVGYVRGTQDLDLLVIDQAVLAPTFWKTLTAPVVVQIFDGRMDWSDPLAGVVQIEDEATAEQVDVVVGKHPRWQLPILERATEVELSPNLPIRVAESSDLVLLKLFAGSPHDDNDIRMLLRTDDGLEAVVEDRIGVMPPREQKRWEGLKGGQ